MERSVSQTVVVHQTVAIGVDSGLLARRLAVTGTTAHQTTKPTMENGAWMNALRRRGQGISGATR